jgi:zinc/manganese transport system substrate-binding protein
MIRSTRIAAATAVAARLAVAAAVALAVAPNAAHAAPAKLRVTCSITDLASIAASVGGPQVEVFAIARPTSDVHRVEVLPSSMVRVAKSDLYVKVGLGLDQWADGIIDGSRNAKIVVVDASEGIEPLDKPTGKVSAAGGDVHPFGNPHYWLDPRNGPIVARHLAREFAKRDPAHAAEFDARADAFAASAAAAFDRGRAIVAAMPVKTIFTYHASWVYLARAFGLEIAANAEPVPGIPPTAKHLAELVQIAKQRKVGVIVQEPYFSDDAGKFLARETGLRVVKASPSCDGPEPGSYLAHVDAVLRAIAGTPAAKS